MKNKARNVLNICNEFILVQTYSVSTSTSQTSFTSLVIFQNTNDAKIINKMSGSLISEPV